MMEQYCFSTLLRDPKISVSFFPYVFACGYAKCVVQLGAVEILLTYEHILSPTSEGFISIWYPSLIFCTVLSKQETFLGLRERVV